MPFSMSWSIGISGLNIGEVLVGEMTRVGLICPFDSSIVECPGFRNAIGVPDGERVHIPRGEETRLAHADPCIL
jgi:hypothetical protein